MTASKDGRTRGHAARAMLPWLAPLAALALLGACASGDSGTGDGGGLDGSLDASSADGSTAMVDAFVPDDDAGVGEDAGGGGVDAGPEVTARTCEACEDHDDCATGSYCVSLSVGGRACVPGCSPDLPSCPRAFSCVLDVASGVDTTVCLPVGGACCVDEDADEHGLGIGCMGPDCNDLDPEINPAADEICDGIDQNCDGTADDPPTDCLSGRCTDDGDGTFTSVTGADCVDAMCSAGTVVDCGEFSCEDGGEAGNACATTCAPDGTDDDTFCVASAHCDGGTCVPDIPNGMACTEDSDCSSAHCENGFCCDTGTCCSVTSDCPGGGGVTTLCDDSRTCQGTRGETMCNASFRCQTMSGIPDDTACDSSTRSKSCGLYQPVFCTGEADQSEPLCADSCATDSDCVDAAHCEIGFCVPDRPPGGSCSRAQDCQAGLSCVDGVCCTSACNGTCEACNLPTSPGTCAPVPAGFDPAGECPAISCAGFFDGFGSGERSCYQRQDVSDAAATCNGGRACTSAATICPTQPRGSVQITCDADCQAPVSGTCTNMTAGACNDLDDPGTTRTCGMGECAVTVQRCTGGRLTDCTPGTPVAETCNGLDDDCNGTADNGSSSALCPPPMVGVMTECNAGSCRLANCPAGFHDVDGNYLNGCECLDDGAGNSCGAALSLGTINPGGPPLTFDGRLIPGQEDWLAVTFPSVGRGPANGTPRVTVTWTGGGANPFRIAVFGSCGAAPGAPLSDCNTAGDAPNAGAVVGWSFRDDASSGSSAFSGSHSVSWPSSVLVRVTRSPDATTCSAASYTITATR